MTVIVAFYCSDGVVVAADSMITPSMGQIAVGHHHGRKIEILSGPQLFAFAGDQGQAARFKILADGGHTHIPATNHPLDFPLTISQGIISQFASTGIQFQMINVNTILSYTHGDFHHCCVFEGPLQPRLLDRNHFYVALGSGKLSADPFLRFVVDVFCGDGIPKVSDATFLAVWTVQHVIDTNSGGVAPPIRVATFHKDGSGSYIARELPDEEIGEHQQARDSALAALRKWRDDFRGQTAADETIAEIPSLRGDPALTTDAGAQVPDMPKIQPE